MLAGEKFKGSNGFEVALFPCEAMYISPARPDPEHDVYALDFLPYDRNGNYITGMPCYAPFSCQIKYTGNDHNCIIESDSPVNTPSGTKYVRVLVAHSEIEPVLYRHYNQGDLFYTTGNYGQSSGEHLHMEVALVDDPSDQYWNTGGIGLYNGVHMWEGLYVNDTTLLRPLNYSWETYNGGNYYYSGRGSFPWVLYARKLREKH